MKSTTVVVAAAVSALALFAKTAYSDEWDPLDVILDSAISEEVWPGCSAAVFVKDKILYKSARGHYTYGVPPPENPNENPSITTSVTIASLSHDPNNTNFFLSSLP